MALTAIYQQNNHIAKGFNVNPLKINSRIQVVTIDRGTSLAFYELTKQWGVQALEYKPFLRYKIADILDGLCEYSLGTFLLNVLKTRAMGGFLLQADIGEHENATDFYVFLSTAISHLIGIPNFDSMYGKYYARFSVRNTDDSDSYLRQAHRRMELHNDGTYVSERTDFVLMMKLAEENMEGGESILLHLDDWEELDNYYHDPIASEEIQWGAPPSKKTGYKINHPVFIENDKGGKPQMLFIDQFAEPQTPAQGLYLYNLSESLENDPNITPVALPIGAMLVLHNHIWLHGREKFESHPELHRELLRQRGHFTM